MNLLKPRPGLSLIHEDARAYLARSHARYDAVLVHLPEPTTFQVNRFYTREWFELIARHLNPGGVLSFSIKGFDSYLEPHRQNIVSSLVTSASGAFDHILPLPGRQIYLLCSDRPLSKDIPGLLADKHIDTHYVQHFFHDDVSPMRMAALSSAIRPDAPVNTDTRPRLMVLMLSAWFYQFHTSPWPLIVILSACLVVYLTRLSRSEFLLFTTGWATMGSELLVIFSFQIFFGFIYYQIGIIVTVFLAGLLPGAYLGTRRRLSPRASTMLLFSDAFITGLLILFAACISSPVIRNHILFYLLFGSMVSFACGFQFPLVLIRGKDRPSSAGRAFSADLMGAAFGVIITSLLVIPFLGIVQSALILAFLKILSIATFRFHSS